MRKIFAVFTAVFCFSCTQKNWEQDEKGVTVYPKKGAPAAAVG
ncbi:MAG: hypothetical protein AB7V25_01560 [Mangrovibacterium sp.]